MFEYERRAAHSMIAADGKLKLYAAVDMMMDCCQFEELTEPYLKNYLLDNSMAIFLASIQIDVIRRPSFGENLKIKVVIYDCKSIYGFRCITIRDEEGKLCYISNAIGAFFNFKEGKAVKLPDDVIQHITINPAEPMECLPRKIVIPREGANRVSDFIVPRSRIDVNQHLTSTEYIALTEDRLPEDFSYDRVRIEYKLQSKAGDVIHTDVYRTGENTILCNTVNEAGHTHAAVEYSRR